MASWPSNLADINIQKRLKMAKTYRFAPEAYDE
jgi:hypothetical protein